MQLENGATIRHRNFLENAWQELGLLKSDDGTYYDPANGMIWSPDPEQRGFIGRRSGEEDDLGRYQSELPEVERKAEPFVKAEPSVYLIESPEDATVGGLIIGTSGGLQTILWRRRIASADVPAKRIAELGSGT